MNERLDQAAMKIGMIGLDTSHCEAFAKLLHIPGGHHVPGGRIVLGYRGGSPDHASSSSRIDRIADLMTGTYGIRLTDTMEELAEQSDAILITSVDGRKHLEQFRAVASSGKPVFVDKPFATSSEDAREMRRLAERYGVPLMSASSLRYTEGMQQALRDRDENPIHGVDCYGPMHAEAPTPFYYWYGVHAVEMMYQALGKGCLQVTVHSNEAYDSIVGTWSDGRIGTIRGNRTGNKRFGAVVHKRTSVEYVDAASAGKPHYAGLLEDVMRFFRTGAPSIDMEETIEIMRFIEAANESRETGQTVRLKEPRFSPTL